MEEQVCIFRTNFTLPLMPVEGHLLSPPPIQMDLNYKKEGYFVKNSDYVTCKFIMQHLFDFGNTRCVHSNDFAVILTNFHFKIHLKFNLQIDAQKHASEWLYNKFIRGMTSDR